MSERFIAVEVDEGASRYDTDSLARDHWHPKPSAVARVRDVVVRIETEECATSTHVTITADFETWREVISAVRRAMKAKR